ncbi:MAG: hypothetical protein HZC29_08365 [Thaumarchaeota archaeon]|nr:hypothetical protein [Nitrososphaerota archaeon]
MKVENIKESAIICLVLTLLVIPGVVFSAPTIYVNNVSANASETVDLPIMISDAADIGSMDIQLSYDSSVLNVTAIDKGTLTANSIFQSNVLLGTAKIAFIDSAGINGNGSVAIITFMAIGSPGTSMELKLDAKANNANDFSNIPLSVSNGILTVNSNSGGTENQNPNPPPSNSGGGGGYPQANPNTTIQAQNGTVSVEPVGETTKSTGENETVSEANNPTSTNVSSGITGAATAAQNQTDYTTIVIVTIIVIILILIFVLGRRRK